MKVSANNLSIISTLALLLLLPQLLLAQQKIWTLKACIDQALHANIALNQSIAGNEINRINYTQSKASQLPNLNLTDQHSLTYGNPIDPSTGRYDRQHISANNLALTGTVTLFNDFKIVNLIKENRLYYEAGSLDVEKMKNDLTLNVVAAYTQVLYEYDAINIAQTQIDVTTEHMMYTEKCVKAGTLPESNLLQVKAQLASDNAAKVATENQLQLAKLALMQLMEVPVDPGFEIARPEQKEITPDVRETPAEIFRTAQGFLPEVKSAVVKTEAAGYAIKISKAAMFPKLTLSGSFLTDYSNALSLISYNTSSSTTKIGYLANDPAESVYGSTTSTTETLSRYPFFRQLGDNFTQVLSLNLSVPIFNNLQFRSDVERAGINLKIAKLNDGAVKNQLRKNVEQAYTDQLAAAKNYNATRQQLIAEERSYHDITIKFRAGTINTTDFFVEKNNYTKAQLTELQARYEYLFKTKVISFYLGNPITD